MTLSKFCRDCHQSDVRFPSRTAPRCVGCTNTFNGARAERLLILRPVPIAVEPVREPDAGEAAHLAMVRLLPCAVRNSDCRGQVEAHHIRTASNSGTGMKPGAEWTTPLCAGHHREYHAIGGQTFQAKYGIDLHALALRLAAASPHIKRTENV